MSHHGGNFHNFTQDPLEVSSSPEHSFTNEVEDEEENRDFVAKFDQKPAKRDKKCVSISSQPNIATENLLKTRDETNCMPSDTETTPLLHPCSSLPTVVGYDEIIDDYPGPSSTTRSEIGRSELVRKRRKRRSRFNTISNMSQKPKLRPLIVSPFMPISTQISIDMARCADREAYHRYGSTSQNLLSKHSSEESSSDGESSEATSSDGRSQLSKSIDILRLLSYKEWVTMITLCLANLCSTVAFSCIAPFYPNEAKAMNVSETQTGIVFGVFEFIMFISSPIFGKYIVWIGAKKMFTFGLGLTGITAILFGFLNFLPAGNIFFWASLVVRVLEALGDAAFVTSSFVITAKCFPNNIAFIVGFIETFAGMGYSIGPVIGGFLYDIGGFQLPFLVLGLVLLLATVISAIMVESCDEEESDNNGKGMLEMMKIKQLWIPISAVVACANTLSFLDPTLSNQLESFKLSPTEIGLMFLLCGGIYTLSAPVFGMVIDSNIGPIAMWIGSIATIVGMMLIGPSPLLSQYFSKSLWAIGISLAILGVSGSAMYVPGFQCCLDIVKSHGFENNFNTYGCVSGIFQAAFGFGSFIGPTVGSVLVESIGFPWTTTIIALLNVVLMIFLTITNIRYLCNHD